jgi:hypothetical protein
MTLFNLRHLENLKLNEGASMRRKGKVVVAYRRWNSAPRGIYSGKHSFVLTGPGIPEDDEPTDEQPELRLQERGGRNVAEPAKEPAEGHTWGFMGTFAYWPHVLEHDCPVFVHDYESKNATVSMEFER